MDTHLSDLEINKICVELMGKPIHNLEYKGMGMYECSCGFTEDETDWHMEDRKELDAKLQEHRTFNPLTNPADYLDFLLFVVNEWEGWEKFLISEGYIGRSDETSMHFIAKCLFINQRTLPAIVAEYVKEGKG